MDNKVSLQRNEAIKILSSIEKENEESNNLNFDVPFSVLNLQETSDEANRIEIQELDIVAQRIIRQYGRNLKINELRKVFDSEPWSKGFVSATSSLIKRYNFFKDFTVTYGSAITPTEEAIQAVKEFGVIPKAMQNEIINDFKATDDVKKAQKNIIKFFKVSLIETSNGVRAMDAISEALSEVTTDDLQPLVVASDTTREKSFVELNSINHILNDVEHSKSLKKADYHQNQSKLFPHFLSMRTNAFLFPSYPISDKIRSFVQSFAQYRFFCLEFAAQKSMEVVDFCRKAKVACAAQMSIFEELFSSFQPPSLWSSSARELRKKLLREIFIELYLLHFQTTEQKRRCTKFLIDMDIFLYHDPPMPENALTSWTDKQKCIWKVVASRFELAIKQLEILILKLKEAQMKFIMQYRAFLFFCKTYPAKE